MRNQLIIAAMAGAMCANVSEGQTLRAISLGTLGGQSAAWAFDGVGRIVCSSATQPRSNLFHPMLSEAGVVTDIGVLPGTTNAFAFAASGDSVFGMSYSFADLTIKALRWQNGVMGTIGNFAPRGANVSGQVVGFENTITGVLRVEHACLWSAGVLTDLGTLGGNYSWAYDINAAGRTVGASTITRDSQTRPCVWVGGLARDLGTLGGADGQAYAISDAGVVVGWSKTAAGEKHGTAWALNSAGAVVTRVDLGLLSGWSYAYGVNGSGVVVGTSNSRAVVWRGGVITDLNTEIPSGTGWRLDMASAVDDAGRICGWGTLFGQPVAYLLVCMADTTADGVVDGADFVTFINSFGAGDPAVDSAADVNGDGIIDGNDFIAFVNGFTAGC